MSWQDSSKEGKEFYTCPFEHLGERGRWPYWYLHILQTKTNDYSSNTKIVEKLGTWMSLPAFLELLGLLDITD